MALAISRPAASRQKSTADQSVVPISSEKSVSRPRDLHSHLRASTEQVHSIFSVVDQASLTCPHCKETIFINDWSSLLGRSGSRRSLSSSPANNAEPVSLEDALASVNRTVRDIDTTLKAMGKELHDISLLQPSEPSRPSSAKSVTAAGEEDEENQSPTASPVCTHSPTQKTKRPPLKTQSSKPGAKKTAPRNIENIPRAACAHNQDSANLGLQHLLVDVDSMKHFAGANIRLLKTLHDRMDSVTIEARQLAVQREAMAKERKELEQMRAELERDYPMLETKGWVEAHRNEGKKISFDLPRAQHQRDADEHAVDSDDEEPDTHAITRTDTAQESTDSGEMTPEIHQYWSQEQEEALSELERRLRKANKRWSDEQEDVLEMIEPLREQKRRAEKAAKKARARRGSLARKKTESPSDTPESPSTPASATTPKSNLPRAKSSPLPTKLPSFAKLGKPSRPRLHSEDSSSSKPSVLSLARRLSTSSILTRSSSPSPTENGDSAPSPVKEKRTSRLLKLTSSKEPKEGKQS